MKTLLFISFWIIYAIIRAIKHTKLHPLLDEGPQKKWKAWVLIDRGFLFIVSLMLMLDTCCYIEVLWLVLPTLFLYALIFNSVIGWINKRDITYIGNRYPDNEILKTFQNKYLYYFTLLTCFSWMFNMIHEYDPGFVQIPGGYVFLFNVVTGGILLTLWKVKRVK